MTSSRTPCRPRVRAGLAVVPHHVELKLGLAGAYYQQEKNSAALVIVEDLIKQSDPPGAAYLLVWLAPDEGIGCWTWREDARAFETTVLVVH